MRIDRCDLCRGEYHKKGAELHTLVHDDCLYDNVEIHLCTGCLEYVTGLPEGERWHTLNLITGGISAGSDEWRAAHGMKVRSIFG